MTTTRSLEPHPIPSMKRQKVAHDALFPTQYLPQPVVRQVLEFLDVPELVQIAGCNKAWREEVYGDNHPRLWRVIRFISQEEEENVDCLQERAPAARMTDGQLSALLRNCRASERCETLHLKGCLGIQGHGLEPLRGSMVLREIDLRLVGPRRPPPSDGEIETSEEAAAALPKVDSSVVLPILSSIASAKSSPPHSCCNNQNKTQAAGLSLVKFDTVNDSSNYYSRFPSEIGDWLYDFHQNTLRKRAEQHHATCGYCRGAMLEGKSEGCKMWIMGTAYCQFCEQYSCGDGTCPSVWTCLDCLVQCCQPMGPKSQGQCPDHKMVYTCHSCTRLQCEDCFEGTMCANEDCLNEYCGDETKGCLDLLQACDKCNSDDEFAFYCPECFPDHHRHCCGSKHDEES